ncbi:uncharacterized protein LOC110862595 [Folsomia candida]|uniref:uncharacterized protein LOC110862595 n=1 Tax=Folsomia candida TaxID=158441 RepID=UPI000B8FD4B3|nr:uncharacterized protein LOC110862595 [Folsomia candida]
MRKTEAAQIVTGTSPPPRFSSYYKNVAVFGWMRRFVNNIRVSKENRLLSRTLTTMELKVAENDILRQLQSEFDQDTTNIYGIPVQKKEDGLFHVKSKILYGKESEEFRWPILLPKSHPIVEMLIRDMHINYCHAGVQFLIGKLREKYWIPQSRRTVKKVIKSCVKCRRYQAKPLEVDPAAALPENRVTIGGPFQVTGVDLAGPLQLRDGKKAWIVLYTCAVYRGIHLDVVTAISTEAFLESLERFINQYGRPNTVYSDNGTNFVGAVNLFKKVDWNKVAETSNVKKIQWIFNPPTAAWWGGWWERMVRSVKDLLKRMLGRAKLNYDQLRTCLSSVAAVINDRPLTTTTEDHEDLIPLTPAMFFKGVSKSEFPESLEISSR